MKVEIWDSDPTSGCCCGPGMMSQQSIQRIMDSINEKNEIMKMLREEFKDVTFEVDTVSSRRPMSSYPPYVSELLSDGARAPMVFIDGKVVVESRFPSYEEFKKIIDEKLNAQRT
jgi:hypothetical protein